MKPLIAILAGLALSACAGPDNSRPYYHARTIAPANEASPTPQTVYSANAFKGEFKEGYNLGKSDTMKRRYWSLQETGGQSGGPTNQLVNLTLPEERTAEGEYRLSRQVELPVVR